MKDGELFGYLLQDSAPWKWFSFTVSGCFTESEFIWKSKRMRILFIDSDCFV